jgi:hypothetical protein
MINHYMTRLVQELECEGISAPLLCEFTLAAVWDDLARLAGETPPASVRWLFEDDTPLTNPSDWGDSLVASPATSSPA